MDISEALSETTKLIEAARMVAKTYEADPDNYSAIQEVLNELLSEFKRIEG